MSVMIKLKSSDGVTYEVDLETGSYIGIIKKMLDDMPVAGDGEIFELPTVSSELLSKIVAWVSFQIKNKINPAEDQAKPTLETGTGTDDVKVEISSADAEFFKMELRTLQDLNEVAHHLDIKGLIELTAKAAASMVEGKSVEEIRSMLRLENDFTDDEEHEIRMENHWIEEGELQDESCI